MNDLLLYVYTRAEVLKLEPASEFLGGLIRKIPHDARKILHAATIYVRDQYYKPITEQYYRADGVSWVPRLILLN